MPSFLDLHNPSTHGAFAPVCTALEAQGGVRCRATDADGTYHAYRMPNNSILGEVLVTPSSSKTDSNNAKNSTSQAERDRVLLIIQRLSERAGLHQTGKTAVITTITQAQNHIRELHKTTEALCRLMRGELIAEING